MDKMTGVLPAKKKKKRKEKEKKTGVRLMIEPYETPEMHSSADRRAHEHAITPQLDYIHYHR
jgi:hypothetical protein